MYYFSSTIFIAIQNFQGLLGATEILSDIISQNYLILLYYRTTGFFFLFFFMRYIFVLWNFIYGTVSFYNCSSCHLFLFINQSLRNINMLHLFPIQNLLSTYAVLQTLFLQHTRKTITSAFRAALL